MKTIWITGSSGFSGRHLARYLRSLDEDLCLIGIDARADSSKLLDRFYLLDLGEVAALRELAVSRPPDYVVHLAGAIGNASEPRLWQANVGGTLRLLQSLAGQTRPRVLSIGSAAEYLSSKGKISEEAPCGGASAYGQSKWAQTLIALSVGRACRLPVVVARPFNIVGPGLSTSLVAGALCSQFARGDGPVQIGRTDSIRDFIDIRDVVSAYWIILRKGSPGRIYNICNSRGTSIKALLQEFQKLSATPRRIAVAKANSRRSDLDSVVGDNSRLRALGWKPRFGLARSVSDMMDDARQNVE
jgi:GDP-4-dehydro-6-deoxy-D-mannose reductase